MQRYGDDMERTLLQLDPETHLLSAAGTAAEADERRAIAAIIDCIRAAGGSVTRDMILDAVGGRSAVVLKALGVLVERKAVRREGTGKKGDPYFFTLISDAILGGEDAVAGPVDDDGRSSKTWERNESTNDGSLNRISDSVPAVPNIYGERKNGIGDECRNELAERTDERALVMLTPDGKMCSTCQCIDRCFEYAGGILCPSCAGHA